jgi:hypothetical protein
MNRNVALFTVSTWETLAAPGAASVGEDQSSRPCPDGGWPAQTLKEKMKGQY